MGATTRYTEISSITTGITIGHCKYFSNEVDILSPNFTLKDEMQLVLKKVNMSNEH